MKISIMKIYFVDVFKDLIKVISKKFINQLDIDDLQKIIRYRLSRNTEKEAELINKVINTLQSELNFNDFEK